MHKLFSYIVKHDHGLAPNPFWDYCTLSCCKWEIRKTASVGDWIAGISSSSKGNRIIYAMKIAEILSFDDYFNDPRFECKKPEFGYNIDKKKAIGDNFYELRNDIYFAHPSYHTNQDRKNNNKDRYNDDLKSENVLISAKGDFYYFGSQPVEIPDELHGMVVGRKYKYKDFTPTFIETFEEYISGFKKGICAYPTLWDKVSTSSGGCSKCSSDYD